MKITNEFEVFEDESELNGADRDLLTEARKAMENAYAPYSNFKVGSAVLLENKKIVVGNNQENIASPSGLCAERVALCQAGAIYNGIAITAIAVIAKDLHQILKEPVTPCGACRQVIAEYELRYNKPIRIIMSGQTGKIIVANSIACLLPLIFKRK